MPGPSADKVLRLAVQRGLLTIDQARKCRQVLGAGRASLAEILRRNRFLDPAEIRDLEAAARAGGDGTPDPTCRVGRGPVTFESDEDCGASIAPVAGSVAHDGTFGPGSRLGRNTIVSELGCGGMGAVYLARDESLGREVALKLIRPGGSDARAALARFEREARTLAAMGRHPNVVQILSFETESNPPYFTMDYVRGGTLAEWLEAAPRTPRVIARMILGVARALEHAHSREIVHRDLKPANVLLDEAENPLVTDFGLAREVEPEEGLTLEGQMLGTPGYMAPEQIDDRIGAIGPATDVFALGVVLYQALTGVHPVRRPMLHETIARTLHAEIVPPRRLVPGLAPDLETIIMRCLAREPARRYAHGGGVAGDLARWLDGEPITARRPTLSYRVARWSGRRKPLVAALTALAVAVVGGVGLAAHLVARGDRQVDDATREAAERVEEVEQRMQSVAETALYKEAEGSLQASLARRRSGLADDLERAVSRVLELAEAALAENPRSTAARFVKGWALRLAGRARDAVVEFDMVVAASPDDLLARYQRGLTLFEAFEEARSGTLSPCAEDPSAHDGDPFRRRAIEDFTKVSEWKAPPPGAARIALGYLALFRDDPFEARRRFEEALHDAPESDDGLPGLCALNHRWLVEHAEEAIEADSPGRRLESIDRALSIAPRFDLLHAYRASALLSIAISLTQEGRYEESIREFGEAEREAARAIELWPPRSVERSDRAETLSGRADVEESLELDAEFRRRALEDADEAVRLDTRSPRAALVRGLVRAQWAVQLHAMDRDTSAILERAIEDYTEALRLDPRNTLAVLWRGEAFLLDAEATPRQLGRALADFDAYADLVPDDPTVYRCRAKVRWLAADGKVDAGEDPAEELGAAIEDYDRFLGPEPDDEVVLSERIAVLLLRGLHSVGADRDGGPDFRRSLADLDRLVELDPDSADHRLLRAQSSLSIATATIGRVPVPDTGLLDRALVDADDYESRGGAAAEAELLRCRVLVLRGGWRAVHDQDPTTDLEAAISAAEAAGEADDAIEAFAALGEAAYALAEWRSDRGVDEVPAWRRATDAYSKGLDRFPEEVRFLAGRGTSQVRLAAALPEDVEERSLLAKRAVSDLDGAILRDPEHWNAVLHRGIAYGLLGNQARAVADFERAREIRPGESVDEFIEAVRGSTPPK